MNLPVEPGRRRNKRLTLLPDAELSGHGSAVETRLKLYADRVSPEEFPALLSPLVRSLLNDSIASSGADGGTFWILDENRTSLTACYNEQEPDIIGLRQPLAEGIISMVLATEQPFCENDVSRHRRHSRMVDDNLGKVTQAMIAVPFYFGSEPRGVFSCIKHADPVHPDASGGFDEADLRRMSQVAHITGNLIDHFLIRLILGLED